MCTPYDISYDEKRYHDESNDQIEFQYDQNGNLIADFDRNICAIRYNVLNLPDTIQFANGNQIVHVYDAEGNRLQTTYYTRRVATVVPALSTLPSTDNLQEYAIVSQANVGNKRYKRSGHGAWQLDYVFNPEGYTRYYGQEEHYRFYYIKDYLGNVREVYVNPEPGYKECVQRTQYYPSGLPWNEGLVPIEQPFKYNGKEFVEMHGLDEYDSEARWYYPAILRTTTMDPLCEKYYSTSPYAWCGNNPVNLVDPDGRDCYVVNIEDGNIQIIEDESVDYVSFADAQGNILSKSGSYEYGTISCMATDEYKVLLSISNAADAEELFKLCAENTEVEWANCTGKDPDGETQYIVGNTHDLDTNGVAHILGKLGFFLTNADHSHTIGGTAGVSDADHKSAVTHEKKYPGIQHRIYLPFVGFFPYDSSTPVIQGNKLEEVVVTANKIKK